MDAARESSELPMGRLIGNKRAIELEGHVESLQKVSNSIEKMAEGSRKRLKVAEELLSIDKQKSMMSLFFMQDADPELRRLFMRLSQLCAICELENEAGVSHNRTDFVRMRSEVPPASSLRDISVPSTGAIVCHSTVPIAIHAGADTLLPFADEPSADYDNVSISYISNQ